MNLYVYLCILCLYLISGVMELCLVFVNLNRKREDVYRVVKVFVIKGEWRNVEVNCYV